jgi:hypothetical protein
VSEEVRHKWPGVKITPTNASARSSCRLPLRASEAKELWTYVEELKNWLKHEIGARLRTLEAKADRALGLTEEIAKLQHTATEQQELVETLQRQLHAQENSLPPTNGTLRPIPPVAKGVRTDPEDQRALAAAGNVTDARKRP